MARSEIAAFRKLAYTIKGLLETELGRQTDRHLTGKPGEDESLAEWVFDLGHGVRIEIHKHWKGAGSFSYPTGDAYVTLVSDSLRTRRTTSKYRSSHGRWPVERVVRDALRKQSENRAADERHDITADQRQALESLRKEEIPDVPEGIHLLRLNNGEYRVSVPACDLPLEHARQIVGVFREARDVKKQGR